MKRKPQQTYVAIKYDVFPYCLVYPLDHMDGGSYFVAGLGLYAPSGILGTMDKETAIRLGAILDALKEAQRTTMDALRAQAKSAIAKAVGEADKPSTGSEG